MENSKIAVSETHVLIIGAGITGLLVAQGLKQAGIPFSIFEREPSVNNKVQEWGLTIFWSLPMLKECLPANLWERLWEAKVDPSLTLLPEEDCLRMFNGQSGELVKAMPVSGAVRVSRRKMRAFCTEGIDVQYASNLKEISFGGSGDMGTVTAIFEDRKSVSGTTLVGCDGAKSRVRSLLFKDPEAASTNKVGDITFFSFGVKYNDAEKAKYIRSVHPAYYSAVHPNGSFMFIAIQDVPDQERPETWSFQLVTSWPSTTEDAQLAERSDSERLKEIKARFADFADPFRSIVSWIPDGTPVVEANIGIWPTVEWDDHDGRVMLLGDAAHPMAPHRGQGLNCCICDASRYIAAVKSTVKGGIDAKEEHKSLAETMKVLKADIVKRGFDEVTISAQNCLMLHDWSKILASPIFTKGHGPQNMPGVAGNTKFQ